MRNPLAVLVAAIALAACAAPPPAPLEARGAARGVEIFATLAPVGTVEWRAAPTFTQLAAMRRRAAILLDRGRISVQVAVEVQAAGDVIRQLLDQALAAGVAKDEARADTLINEASTRLHAARDLLARSVR